MRGKNYSRKQWAHHLAFKAVNHYPKFLHNCNDFDSQRANNEAANSIVPFSLQTNGTGDSQSHPQDQASLSSEEIYVLGQSSIL